MTQGPVAIRLRRSATQPSRVAARPAQPTTATARMLQQLGAGERMPVDVRSYFEPRFGADFSNVRLHRDRAADDAATADATAFSVGNHVAFAGKYDHATISGCRPSRADRLPDLQRAAGNRAVAALLNKDPGRPLDARIRSQMEAQFACPLDGVRVHTDENAASAALLAGANAFTYGRHIVFGHGRYTPGTSAGSRLLAHELAHVVQQSRRGAKPPEPGAHSAAEQDASAAAEQFAGGGPVAVDATTGPGLARQESDEPWWKRRLNPLYQRALEVLPKPLADRLEQANAVAKQYVAETGTSDQTLNQVVAAAEPVLAPTEAYFGLGTADAPDKQTRDANTDGSSASAAPAPAPVRADAASSLPPLDVLLRPDPPPTNFETQLRSGKPFHVQFHPKPDLDPRSAYWLGRRPTDEEMKKMRFEDINDPSRPIYVDEGKAVDLGVDADSTMPIRDPKTNMLLGYRVRHGDTMYVLNRNGEVRGTRNLEAPLEHPAIDPIDVAMLAVDLGPLAAKGLQAGGKALIEAASRSATSESARLASEETSAVLARQASDALESGVSHPRDFPGLDLGGKPANDVVNFRDAQDLPQVRLGGQPVNDVTEAVEENQLRLAAGHDVGQPATVGSMGGGAPPPPRFTRLPTMGTPPSQTMFIKEGDLPEGTSKITTTLKPRTAMATDEEVLRANMERAQKPVPEGHAAHHLVPKKGGGKAGDRARSALKRSNIDINDADNGLAAPGTHAERGSVYEPGGAPYHGTMHTDAYYNEVARRLSGVRDEARAREILRRIAQEVKDGTFPH